MPLERRFLGWDAPLTAKMRDFLLPSQLSGPVDLGRVMIIVPTRQAGRRLRQALAVQCAGQETALLSPRVVIPTFFFHRDGESAGVASQTEVAAVWADVLLNINPAEYNGLFPARPPNHDFIWAMHTGEMIQQLRSTIMEGGYQIADLQESAGTLLQEPERWLDLAMLETIYMNRLRELGLRDPCGLMIKRSEKPGLPEGVERIIVAAVPDPTPLMIRALEHLSEQVSIVILVHAPDSLADYFDDWGRPVAGKWTDALIDIPNSSENTVLAGVPASQSRRVMDLISSEVGRFGPADIAVGVPDTEITPFLSADLADKGLPAFDPAGKILADHPLYHLLEAFRALVNDSSYASFSTFLRQADVLDCLQQKLGVPPRKVLEELDKFQNRHLPVEFEDIARYFPHEEESQQYENLEKAVTFVHEQIRAFEEKDLAGAVRSFLKTIYEASTVNPGNPGDEEFIAVADSIDSLLREFASESIRALTIGKRHGLELLMRMLGKQRYYMERESAVIDLQGWLELPWEDAPFLIVTGMNDGSVPDGQLSDVFLPDSLRGQLNLRQDADRLARDAYLMRTLIESRREEGRVCFISGKTSAAGDPLKPSRLLFRCRDEELPDRARRLFGDTHEKSNRHPPTISFPLEVTPPLDFPTDKINLKELSVTSARDYLKCPFRFYLKHILGMEALDDEKTEMDALDFGLLIHHVMHRLAGNERMRQCERYSELSDFLCSEVDDWATARFGPSPPLQVVIQLDAARQRLAAAAALQAALAREGWEILESELKVEAELNGMIFKGRIDRVDLNLEDGRFRILDYKTSDKAIAPENDHFSPPSAEAREYAKVFVNGRERRWANLQLPLYQLMLREREEFTGPVELGYFNLPKALQDTGVATWGSFSDEILESARNCAEGIAGDIRDRRFWPPSERVENDEFAGLFHADVADCINLESFRAFMGGRVV